MDAEIEAKKETDGEVSLGDIVESEFTEEREGRKVFFYILNVILSNWEILQSYKSMIGITPNPNSLGTHIHLAA